MSEKIGEVYLDDTNYPGQDFYTDGAVEDELLKIARDYPEEKWNQVIAERGSWPVLYHFSHVRENILSWLPFTGEENVLEIGSGCGAVTGALCKRAKTVTCIELSKKRSLINAYRHRSFKNLRILLGNFQDVEKTLTEKYDYITLIGVFEYGEAYIKSRNPYTDFLKIIARHLKPDGKIVLAIENRLGLKYWAGCTEDHFGTLFEGLEGYPNKKGVRTFSRKELGELLKKAGGLKAAWYYPFPDYKLPTTIFSDRRLPKKGELNRVETNYDRLRLKLFEESPVYDSLLDNDLFPEFSNSFLLLVGREEPKPETVYVKFSNERAPEFSLRTEIAGDPDGHFYVRKLPEDSRASAHVKRLEKLCRELSGLYAREGLEMNACVPEGSGVRLEFLKGETLEERLDALLAEGRTSELEKLLFTYVEKLRRLHGGEVFYKTPEFVRVFGDVSPGETYRAGGLSNIDLVPANILIDENRVSVIDYEWTFRFPVPGNYILYRMLHYYLESDGKRRMLKDLDFYKKAGLTGEEIKIYEEMERNFQNYMQGDHVSLLDMYEEVSPGKAEILPWFEKLKYSRERRLLQVFFDRGEGFKEEDSVLYPLTRKGFALKIPYPASVRRLRLDPGEAAGGLTVKRMDFAGGGAADFSTNGFYLGGDRYYFGGGDPQFILEDLPEGAGSLNVEMEIMSEPEGQETFWKNLSEITAEKDAELKRLKEQIRQMEGTKVWKLYKKIKKQ